MSLLQLQLKQYCTLHISKKKKKDFHYIGRLQGGLIFTVLHLMYLIVL